MKLIANNHVFFRFYASRLSLVNRSLLISSVMPCSRNIRIALVFANPKFINNNKKT